MQKYDLIHKIFIKMKKIILLHGALGSSSQFAEFAKMLKPQFEVHFIDFSGHGGVDFHNRFGIDQFTEELSLYIHNNELEEAIIFGFSMGGYVALNYAKNNPNSTNPIFTLGTMLNFDKEKVSKEVDKMKPEIVLEKVPHYAKMLEDMHEPTDWKELLSKTADMMRELSNNPTINTEDFSKIGNKVMLAIGDRDNTADLNSTIETYKLLKNGNLLVIPNCKHPFEKMDLDRLVYEISNF